MYVLCIVTGTQWALSTRWYDYDDDDDDGQYVQVLEQFCPIFLGNKRGH